MSLLTSPPPARAQSASAEGPRDPFAGRGWHLELALHGALETWNYNTSREELSGLSAGVTYGLTEGLVLTTRAPLYYVGQRGKDALLFGVIAGVRSRVFGGPRASMFVEFDVGISEADTITPPRGTRFNYLALGGAGGTFALGRRVHLLGVIRWIHVSNGGRAGRSRNPDIEAVGPQIGVLVPF